MDAAGPGHRPDPVPPLARAVTARYAALPDVVAIALGGSRAGPLPDHRSDIDLYVYADPPPALAAREAIAAAFGTRREVGNAFWEPGDEWDDDASGVHVDVLFRSPAWIADQVARVLDRHEASLGYSTALWHGVREAVPLFDREGWLARLQEAAARPYPEPLRRAVVAKNHPILRRAGSSYRHQIELALARGDPVSVNHRLAALLASFFDVLFALNRRTHPGEKRLLDHAEASCPLRPPALRRRVADLLGAPAADLLPRLDILLDDLDALLAGEGLLDPTVGPVPAARP